jgi:hypothetical protein
MCLYPVNSDIQMEKITIPRIYRFLFCCLSLFCSHHALCQTSFFAKQYDLNTGTFLAKARHPSGFSFLLSSKSVIKIDQDGNMVWKKDLTTDPLLNFKSIAYSPGSGFQISAHRASTATLHFLLIDENGTLLSTADAAGNSTDGGHFFIGQDSLLVTGTRNNQAGSRIGFAELYNARNATRLWGYTTSINNVEFIRARRVNDNIIALGGRQSGARFSKGTLALLGKDGKEKWINTYPSVTNGNILDVAEAPDRTLRAILWSGKRSSILSLSEQGVLMDSLRLPLTEAKFIYKDPADHKFVVVGRSRSRLFISKLNANSQIEWWRFYGNGFGVTSESEDIRGVSFDDNTWSFWGIASTNSVVSSPFLVSSDRQGSVGASQPSGLQYPTGRILLDADNAGGETQLLTTTESSNENELVLGGYRYFYPPNTETPVTAGVLAGVTLKGDTLWTKTTKSVTPYGYVDNSIINAKLNSQGEIVVHERIGQGISSTGNIYALSNGNVSAPTQVPSGKRSDFSETASGKLVLCSHTFDSKPYNEVGSFLSIDLKNGSVIGLPKRLVGSKIHNMLPSGKGTFYVSGEQSETFKTSQKGYWAEVDENGNVLKSNTYDLGFRVTINDMRVTTQGNTVCAGASEDENGNRDLLLFEIDASGNLLWHKTYDILNTDEIHSLQLLPDGYLVAGETGRPVFGLQQSFAFLCRISLDREITFKKYYGIPGLYARAIKAILKNGAAVIIGNSEQWYSTSPALGGSAFIETVEINGNEVTGLDDDHEHGPMVYPNPFSNRVIIQCKRNSSVTFLNLIGQVVQHTVIPGGESYIDTSAFSAGIYFIRIDDGKTIGSFKMLCAGK